MRTTNFMRVYNAIESWKEANMERREKGCKLHRVLQRIMFWTSVPLIGMCLSLILSVVFRVLKVAPEFVLCLNGFVFTLMISTWILYYFVNKLDKKFYAWMKEKKSVGEHYEILFRDFGYRFHTLTHAMKNIEEE